MKVTIENMYNIMGRGWILAIRDDRLSHCEVPCGSTITVDDIVFTIKGTERTKYDDGWYSPHMGINLSPNDQVSKHFYCGQVIEIETKNV